LYRRWGRKYDYNAMSDPQMFQFGYASKPPPWHRRKRVRRSLLIVIVLVLLLSAWSWGPRLWQRVRVAYWQHRCLVYTAPVDQVIYEEDPTSARMLLASPDCAMTANNPQFVARRPWPWREFPSTGVGADGVAFLHERMTPSGQRRLVVVEVWLRWPVGTGRQVLQLNNYVIRPRAMAARPEIANNAVFCYPVEEFSSLASTDRVRLFAGQPDASDPTHFTIGYAVNGKTGTIDGWLTNVDRVNLQVRDGPAKKP
jgi:hypothetical protein